MLLRDWVASNGANFSKRLRGTLTKYPTFIVRPRHDPLCWLKQWHSQFSLSPRLPSSRGFTCLFPQELLALALWHPTRAQSNH